MSALLVSPNVNNALVFTFAKPGEETSANAKLGFAAISARVCLGLIGAPVADDVPSTLANNASPGGVTSRILMATLPFCTRMARGRGRGGMSGGNGVVSPESKRAGTGVGASLTPPGVVSSVARLSTSRLRNFNDAFFNDLL